jgi:hypothetical protein
MVHVESAAHVSYCHAKLKARTFCRLQDWFPSESSESSMRERLRILRSFEPMLRRVNGLSIPRPPLPLNLHPPWALQSGALPARQVVAQLLSGLNCHCPFVFKEVRRANLHAERLQPGHRPEAGPPGARPRCASAVGTNSAGSSRGLCQRTPRITAATAAALPSGGGAARPALAKRGPAPRHSYRGPFRFVFVEGLATPSARAHVGGSFRKLCH